ncbi:uncharacterized protein LOC115888261 [Sitophilus oryzae]|uniref:Uncharacterized protein LOC115888261 n=1 Tax=Sitophilus oryzae TaxID=7048 RepID=A0A6J2YID6_SITOR|nr:uncharacterized protein LOC115888261 [Sitophilus oryzae]
MSTLSGTASKGEKSKQKFQSLDINSLYKSSRGENTEKPAQKSSASYIKHGMQSLGKVPNARRAPANLPSIKSEHSESGAAVPLVPPGATGWGKQEQGGTQQPPPNVQQNGAPQNHVVAPQVPGPQLTPHQQAIAIPSTNAIPPHNKQSTVTAPPAGSSAGDKLWSAVMASGPADGVHPPAYQSPQFQHEFPTLSAGDGVGGSGPRAAPEYAPTGPAGGQPGLSLRPQTEGSWTQGGQRPPDGAARPSSAIPATAPQLPVQAGRQPEHLPPQVRGVLPPFMYKSSFPQGSATTVTSNHPHAQAPAPGMGGRRMADNRPPRLQDRDVAPEELTPRPIIREEELSKLDEFGPDMGWAVSDDIDYNQKLAFSDDESERPSKKDYKTPQQQYQQHKPQEVRVERQTPPRHWNPPRPDYRGRQSEEDDIIAQKQRQHQKEVDLIIQRATHRKQEELKRNEENRQRKLQEIGEKVRGKHDRESDVAPISSTNATAKPANHVEIPLPDFHKDKDKESQPRLSNEAVVKDDNSSFRQMTQIEGKNFARKPQQKPDRDHRDQNVPNFSRHFQSDLPPRFLRHQRNNGASQPNYQHYDSNKWSSSMPRAPSRSGKSESPERRDDDRRDKDYKRQSSEDSYRSSHHAQQDMRRSQDNHGYEDNHNKIGREEGKWSKDKGFERKDIERENHDKFEEKQERPARPDSRDSYTSHASHTSHGSQGSNRRSRDGDIRESMSSWNEDVEAHYTEKREKEQIREEKRQVSNLVPGPITRDRIEAEDVNEKRNLTQLKKGEMPIPKKIDSFKKEEVPPTSEKLSWADYVPTEEPENKKDDTKLIADTKKDDYKERQNRNNRNFSQSKSWGSGNSDFHTKGPSSSSWGKQRPPSRSHKHGGRDFYGHGTDSDGSTDTHSIDSKDSKALQKKVTEKDEKNRDNKHEKFSGEHRKQHEKTDKKEGYIPRGEPSRHGRGGGSNFRGNRMGGLAKRIDGYGPPPSRSPFGHHEERDKKVGSDETSSDATGSAPTLDKVKQNQEALAAGIIGKSRQETNEDKNKNRPKYENKRNKSKSRKDELEKDSNSEHSDSKDGGRKPVSRSSSQKGGPGGVGDRRVGGDRRNNSSRPLVDKRPSYENKKPDAKPDPQTMLTSAIADISLKGSEDDDKEEKNVNGDSEGFQEVKSKKAIKERQKGPEEKKPAPNKVENKDVKPDRKPGGITSKPNNQQMTQQQIQNIPPLMATPVNPPPVLPQSKNQYDQRSRQNKLPPRFVKQKMQKQMQQHIMNDVGDMGKNSQSAHMYGIKENAQVSPTMSGCAWDKPLGSQLRSTESDANNMLTVSLEAVKLEVSSATSGSDKILPKQSQMADKNLLDGSTPPVNTIIFENTNFKSAPGARSTARSSVSSVGSDKTRSKLSEDIDNGVFRKSTINELLHKAETTGKTEPIQLTVFKEETDMKLDFFGTDLTHLTDDKGTKNLCGTKSMTSVNSTICNADSLNMKIASVKKVWETSEQESEDTSGITFGGPVIETVFKGSDGQDDNHETYSPGNNQSASTTNVCKVKPTQQISSGAGQVASSTSQQQHSAIVGHPILLNPPLSPPPMASAPVGVSLGPQPYATNQHLASYQAATGQGVAAAGSAQFSISAVPSPPTVLYNSTQQLPSANLYGAFMQPTDQTSLLGGQGHARAGGFGQYPTVGAYHGIGQAANSHYNTQSVYLQTAAHAPPTAQAPPELYPSMNSLSSYRMSAAPPFGQNPPLNNPTTVLISSTSNSLMSASVKPSSHQIGAIGTKAGGVGQAYQQSQQSQQVYMTYDPSIQAANYLPGAGVMQRGPAGPPVQNSVVPGLQPSSSYYSGSTGGQSGYFQQPGNSSMPSAAQLPQHQAGYGLQGNVFGTHNQSHTNTAMQGYSSFLSPHMQMALSAQQFRSAAAAGLTNPYHKGNMQSVSDQGQRPQQLKSPGSQETSIFNPAPQIPSPKSRQSNKHIPQQSSPTSQRKYFYQGVTNQQSTIQQRYPTPIQRPINCHQQNMNSVQNNGSNISKHNRNNPNKPPNKQYYGGQNNPVSTGQNDKSDDSKISDCSATKTVSATASDLSKDNLKEETQVLKD